MQEFIKYLYDDVSKSSLGRHISRIEDFLQVWDDCLLVNLKLLSNDYYDKFVRSNVRAYAQNFIHFSTKAMVFQHDITVFRFAFVDVGVLFLEFDLNDYRRQLVGMIDEEFPELSPVLDQKNEIILYSDDVDSNNKYIFSNKLIPILGELNKRTFKISTRCKVLDRRGRMVHSFIFN